MRTAVVIVAAGRGNRAGLDPATGQAKQWRVLAGQRVIDHTLAAFQNHPKVSDIILVLHPEDMDLWERVDGVVVTGGGADRAASVTAGLAALAPEVSHVLIHDVARPCVSAHIISAVIEALSHSPAAAPAVAVTDALWHGRNGKVTGTQERAGLFRAQTPQGFQRDLIAQAHASHPGSAADDVEVARAFGLEVAIVPGEDDNIKITTPDDFARAHRTLTRMKDTL